MNMLEEQKVIKFLGKFMNEPSDVTLLNGKIFSFAYNENKKKIIEVLDVNNIEEYIAKTNPDDDNCKLTTQLKSEIIFMSPDTEKTMFSNQGNGEASSNCSFGCFSILKCT